MAQAKRSIPLSQIVEFIAPIQSQICTILAAPSYKATNPFNVRSLLDLSIFEIHMCNHPHDWVSGAFLFQMQPCTISIAPGSRPKSNSVTGESCGRETRIRKWPSTATSRKGPSIPTCGRPWKPSRNLSRKS